MEKRFVEIFTGLKRDYGYADPQSAYKDPSTGKLKIEHFWAIFFWPKTAHYRTDKGEFINLGVRKRWAGHPREL